MFHICRFVWLLFLLLPVLSKAETADRIVVNKSQHEMVLYRNGVVLSKYHVTFGANPVGHKQQSGDERTPEGRYVIDFKKADSAFHKALHISYPNTVDVEKAKRLGVNPGGDIMIHGQRNGFGWAAWFSQKFNWTDGCIALTNADMDEVWRQVEPKVVIDIYP
jgi:murein L,D-transpeptidase YafK